MDCGATTLDLQPTSRPLIGEGIELAAGGKGGDKFQLGYELTFLVNRPM